MNTDMHYLQLLSQSFPNIAEASTEIINLEAIMNLPKGTEHFLADLHGESEAFQHVLKNASGNIKRKVNELFGNDILVPHHHPPVGEGVSRCLVEVHPFEGAQVTPTRLLLYYRRIAPREPGRQ